MAAVDAMRVWLLVGGARRANSECALRERFLGGAGLRRAASAVMKQRLAALCDARESWSMQLLCARGYGKTLCAAN
jgi:hypothetical protein